MITKDEIKDGLEVAVKTLLICTTAIMVVAILIYIVVVTGTFTVRLINWSLS